MHVRMCTSVHVYMHVRMLKADVSIFLVYTVAYNMSVLHIICMCCMNDVHVCCMNDVCVACMMYVFLCQQQSQESPRSCRVPCWCISEPRSYCVPCWCIFESPEDMVWLYGSMKSDCHSWMIIHGRDCHALTGSFCRGITIRDGDVSSFRNGQSSRSVAPLQIIQSWDARMHGVLL